MSRKLTVEIEFEIKDIVYHKTDKSQEPFIVIGYCIYNGGLLYEVRNGSGTVSACYGFEISLERDILLATTN